MRLYGRRFWPSLALGVPPSILNVLARTLDDRTLLVSCPWSAPSDDCAARRPRPGRARASAGRVWQPLAAGVLVFLPVRLLRLLFLLPALAWLALVGSIVPVLALERVLGLRSGPRSSSPARTSSTRSARSRPSRSSSSSRRAASSSSAGHGDQTLAIASFGDLVVSPLLFLGAALLYFDQEARDNGERVPRR